MELRTSKAQLLFGGNHLPRLRVLSIVVLSVLTVLTFVLAAPAPVHMDADIPADVAFVFIRLSMLLCAAAGVGCGAFLLTLSPLPVTLALIPATGALSFFLTRDLLTAVSAMCFFVPVVLLWRLLGRGMPRTAAVLRLSACLGAVFLPFFFRSLAAAFGTTNPGVLFALLNDACTAAFSSCSFSFGTAEYGYTEQSAAMISQLLLILSPAMVMLLCNITAWLGHVFALMLFRTHGLEKLFPPAVSRLTMSRMSAVIFFAACLGSSVFGIESSVGMAEALSLNLFVLLEPPFVGLGVRAVLTALRRSSSMLIIFVIFALLFCNISICLLLLACIGAGSALRNKKQD